ncbi:MAG: hypothetical protein EHM61_10060 [Acidobacteria bacterium]|nr:MAG: hypothetical protein EHM61_10060 [Acidobacteriota bacterium]
MQMLVSGVVPILFLALILAESPCNDPLHRLKDKEAKKILADSPWSKTTIFLGSTRISALDQEAAAMKGNEGPRGVIDAARGYGGDKGSGIHGEKELHYTYTCRLYSALPVRQAYVRMWQTRSKYDNFSPEQQRLFDDRVSPFLRADTSKEIVVSIELQSNDRRTLMEVGRRLREATRETLRENAGSPTGEIPEQAPYLISDHLGRVSLKAYYPPSEDGTGAKLVFPREIDGEPVVLPKDKEVKLEFLVPGSGHKLYIAWKIEDLMCDGQPLL